MNKILYALMTLVLLAGFSACKEQGESSKKLAQVGSDILYEADFQASFGAGEWDKLSSENKRKYIEQWVNITLLAQEADRQELDKDPILIQKIEYAAKKLKSNAVISSRLAEIDISEDDLFNYYRIHMGEFQKPLMEYKVQRIYVKDQSRIERIKNEIQGGLAFDAAVSIFSAEPLRDKGGYMGFVSSTGPDSLFWTAAKNLQKGELGVLAANEGWYIIRHYEERNSEGESSFDLHKDEIRKRILQERRHQVFDELLLELKQKEKDIYYY